MSKDFLQRASGAGEPTDDLLPPLPPITKCAKGTHYLPPQEHRALRFALAQLEATAGVTVSLNTLLRLGLLLVKPRLDEAIRQKRPLSAHELYTILLGPSAPTDE